MEMALQDAMRVCNPDIKTPFQSIEDAVNRCANRCIRAKSVYFPIPMRHPNLDLWYLDLNRSGVPLDLRVCDLGDVLKIVG